MFANKTNKLPGNKMMPPSRIWCGRMSHHWWTNQEIKPKHFLSDPFKQEWITDRALWRYLAPGTLQVIIRSKKNPVLYSRNSYSQIKWKKFTLSLYIFSILLYYGMYAFSFVCYLSLQNTKHVICNNKKSTPK